MAEQALDDELRAALIDIQRYLLDQIPPLTASDAVQTLIARPPDILMRQINVWAAEQSRLQGATMSDCLFHALRKIHMVSRLKLVDEGALAAYLESVIPMALQACPASERELLRSNLLAMRAQQGFGSAADMVHGSSTPIPRMAGAAAKKTVEEPLSRTARRLSLIIDRLSKAQPPAATGGAAPGAPAANASASAPPLAQLLSMAAANSASEQELNHYLESLRPWAGSIEAESVIKALAASIPAWEIAPPAGGAKPRRSSSAEAIHKVVSLTQNQMEVAKRLRELLMSAVEQFNAGSLGAAVSMLEVADVVIVEKKIDSSTVDRIRADAVEAISGEQLKKYTENKSKHALLRKALASFPTLTTESLLEQLRGEERPERRRALLALLEAWGPAAREGALAQLEAELNRPQGEIDTYYLRNVIYLLHRIPRDEAGPVQKELELLTRASARGQSIYVIKEAVLPLANIRNDASVRLLTTRLAECETLLLRNDPMYPADEMHKLLERITNALGKIGTPAALLTIARHGMKANPLLGDTRGRLSVLSQHDLSFDGQTVALLIKTIREDLPNKFLGKLGLKRQPPPVRLIEALSSTRSEEVELLFLELTDKFPDQEVGRAAAAALESLEGKGKQAASDRSSTLTGDLQFFGLPSLMQSLAESQATGIVTLVSKTTGQTGGKILFVEGKVGDAQVGNLRGPNAIYYLLERPVVGTFSFVPQPSVASRAKGELLDIMPLLFEGIRRHDELKQITIMVPDAFSAKAGSVKPTPHPEETDPALTREVWLKALSGTPIADWESQVAVDPYRVRRLVAGWVEEGALQSA